MLVVRFKVYTARFGTWVGQAHPLRVITFRHQIIFELGHLDDACLEASGMLHLHICQPDLYTGN